LIKKYQLQESEFLNIAASSYLTPTGEIDYQAVQGFCQNVFANRVVNEPKTSSNPPPNNLAATKTTAIQKITQQLALNPPITNNELSENCRNWEAKINGLTEPTEITNFKEEVLADIRIKRETKIRASKMNEDIQNAQGKSGENLKADLEKFEGDEGSEAYEKNKEEVKKLNEKLAQEDPKLYRQKAINVLSKKMATNEIKDSELTAELKKD
jgi:hypothetical protein